MVVIARARADSPNTVRKVTNKSDTTPEQIENNSAQEALQNFEESIASSNNESSQDLPGSPWDDTPAESTPVEENDIPNISEVFGTKQID